MKMMDPDNAIAKENSFAMSMKAILNRSQSAHATTPVETPAVGTMMTHHRNRIASTATMVLFFTTHTKTVPERAESQEQRLATQ